MEPAVNNDVSPGISRRTVLRATAGLAGAVLVTACGSSGENSGDAISFMNWDQVEGTPLGDALAAFEQQTGQRLAVQPAVTGDAYNTHMRTLLAGGNPPDVMRINDDFVRAYSLQGALLDLKPYIERDRIDVSQYAQAAFEFGAQPDGSHTAWVIGYQPTMIFYNADMFAQAGVPLPPQQWSSPEWNWATFEEYAQRLTGRDRRWGALVYGYTGYEQTFAVNHGSSSGIFSPDGRRFTLADPEGVETIQWVVDLTCEKQVQPPWSELQQTNAALQLFAEGRIGMMLHQSGVVPYLRRTIRDFTWGIASPPADVDQRSEVSVVVLMIPASARNPDGAWELLKFLAGAEGGRLFAGDGTFLPVHRDAIGAGTTQDVPQNLHLFAESADHLTTPNQTANTPAAREVYRSALDAVLNCERRAGDVLTEVRPQVESLLQRGA
jgi:multiple sugar transport system substrate-binding protein